MDVYCVSLCASLLFFLCSAELEWQQNKAALFIFGDSLYDAGANNYINTTLDFRANFSPYGESFFHKNPTGRFSDGRLVPDFIAEYLELPLIPPYLLNPDYTFHGGANFASGGAGALVETHAGLVVDLQTQLVQFKKVVKNLRNEFGDGKAKRVLSKAVYMVSAGGNDYLAPNTTLNLSISSREEYVDMVIGNITTVIKGIHNIGGRKFVFVTLPPVGCLPQTRSISGRSGGCLREANKLAQIHNNAFRQAVKKLGLELEGLNCALFELYDVLLKRINHPSKYGFKDGKSACCGSGPYGGIYSCGRGDLEYELCKDPSEYVFFDSFHPSERAYEELAELMWKGKEDVIRPYNIKDLVHGIIQ